MCVGVSVRVWGWWVVVSVCVYDADSIALQLPIIRSYLETFPFSFYLVLQDIKSLPVVLGKALRQWFELLTEH